jgi:hypothetical protein
VQAQFWKSLARAKMKILQDEVTFFRLRRGLRLRVRDAEQDKKQCTCSSHEWTPSGARMVFSRPYMFWLSRSTFWGSYFFLISTNRA